MVGIVVVTGAGASVGLGVRESLVPMMAEWSASLRKRLSAVETATTADLPTLLGLTEGQTGEEFEQWLGDLLRLQRDLPLLKKYQTVGAPSTAGPVMPNISQWENWAQSRLQVMIEHVRADLFENFGANQFDRDKAIDAYAWLKGKLSQPALVPGDLRLAYATTNYDSSLEMAIDRVDDGFVAPYTGAMPTLDLTWAAKEWTPEAVPVLHLHGAVGWYRDGNVIGKHYPNQPYLPQPERPPALLLPDPDKTIGTFTEGAVIWEKLKTLLAQADGVLVLGHSLHDPHLMTVIREAGIPTAVAAYVEQPSASDPAERDLAQARSQLPEAAVFSANFGRYPVFRDGPFNDWLQSAVLHAGELGLSESSPERSA